MSEKMIPLPFRDLMAWIVDEYGREGSVFGVLLSSKNRAPAKYPAMMFWAIWVLGPAAGPKGASSRADVIVMDYKPYTPFSGENIDGHMLFGMTR